MVVGRRARGTARGRGARGRRGSRGSGSGEEEEGRRAERGAIVRVRSLGDADPSRAAAVHAPKRGLVRVRSRRGDGGRRRGGARARRRGRRAFLRPREGARPSSSVATSAPAATSAHRVSTWTAAIDAARRRPRPRRARMPSDGDACAARGGGVGEPHARRRLHESAASRRNLTPHRAHVEAAWRGRRAAKDHRRHEPRRCPGISARGERRRRSQTGAANSR